MEPEHFELDSDVQPHLLQEMTPPADTEDGVRRSARQNDKPTPLKVNPTKGVKRESIAPLEEECGPRKVKVTDEDEDEHGLSAYELERLENIKQNQDFLCSIKLLEAGEALKQRDTTKPSTRGLQRKPKSTVKEVLPARKSLRLQNKDAVSLTLPPEPSRDASYEHYQPPRKLEGPISMEAVNMEKGSQLPPGLLRRWAEDSVKEEKPVSDLDLDLKEYRASLRSMRLTGNNVVKVVKDRVFSAAFHPGSSHLLMAAGDKWGRVGLWNLDSDEGEDGVLLFEPHTRPVGCMAFSRTRPASLLSLSYDGTLRSTDLEKAVFEEVYRVDDGLKTFDFLSHDCSTLVVGDWQGGVAIVDRRTPGTSHESIHSLDSQVVRCVHVHPVQKQYFVVAENRVVSIYDARCLKKSSSQAVSQLIGHSLSISSAFFSPHTGDRVLTSCLDNNIRIYDTSELTSKAPLLTSMRHDMHTGRWLSKLQAVWDPKREDCFVVGSMERPRRMQVFHQSGQLQHTFRDDENLSTVCSITAFHPSRNALLGGNASGRLHLFTD